MAIIRNQARAEELIVRPAVTRAVDGAVGTSREQRVVAAKSQRERDILVAGRHVEADRGGVAVERVVRHEPLVHADAHVLERHAVVRLEPQQPGGQRGSVDRDVLGGDVVEAVLGEFTVQHREDPQVQLAGSDVDPLQGHVQLDPVVVVAADDVVGVAVAGVEQVADDSARHERCDHHSYRDDPYRLHLPAR
jgi:hypothetical protein